MKGFKHGLSRTPIYEAWKGMKGRCNCSSDVAYKNYGGRGIKVCSEWENDPIAFYNWSINNGWKKGLSIDRIDNNKGYSPDNCRWTTKTVQNRNRRCVLSITYKGETHTLKEWSKITGINYQTLLSRINTLHWSIEKTLEKEPLYVNQRIGGIK